MAQTLPRFLQAFQMKSRPHLVELGAAFDKGLKLSLATKK